MRRTWRIGKAPPNRLPPGVAMRNSILTHYKYQAKKRGLEWALTEERFDKLVHFPCHYCGRTYTGCASGAVRFSDQGHILSKHNGDFLYNGIDRLDNKVGYTVENTVSCCKICNRAKKDMPPDKFVQYLLEAGHYRLSRVV